MIIPIKPRINLAECVQLTVWEMTTIEKAVAAYRLKFDNEAWGKDLMKKLNKMDAFYITVPKGKQEE